MATRLVLGLARILRASRAAEYAGYSCSRTFLAAVSDGTMPAPFQIGGADAWDVADLDASIDAIKAGAQPPRRWQEQAPARV